MQSHGDMHRASHAQHSIANRCYKLDGEPLPSTSATATAMDPLSWSLRISTLLLLCLSSLHALSYLNSSALKDPLWNCSFEKNACHFRNQYNLARFIRYYNPDKPFRTYRSALILDLATQNARKFPGARLITHYFPAKYANACLYMSYLMEGPGPSAFYVIQQDKENKCIYGDEGPFRDSKWNYIELQLNLTEGDPRFFLESQYDITRLEKNQAPGYIAISTFSFSYGNCDPRRNKVNYCFSDFNKPIQAPEAVK